MTRDVHRSPPAFKPEDLRFLTFTVLLARAKLTAKAALDQVAGDLASWVALRTTSFDREKFIKQCGAEMDPDNVAQILRYGSQELGAYRWTLGDLVQKKQWRGRIVGFYETKVTKRGYCVESAFEEGSVQVWPEAALEDWDGK